MPPRRVRPWQERERDSWPERRTPGAIPPDGARRLSHALQLCALAHHGQYRKYTGEPYAIHPIRVMLALADKSVNVQIAALLHDTVEDTTVLLSDIRRDFGDEVTCLVDAVSRRKGETYADFISRVIAAGMDAIEIKLADIEDNMGTEPTERYSKACARLMEARRLLYIGDLT